LRAAEVALALGRGSHRAVCALHIADPADARGGRLLRTRLREETVLKDVAKMADHTGASVRTAIRINAQPAEAIAELARGAHSDLIVLGVTRKPGEALDFGDLASEIIAKTEASILLISD